MKFENPVREENMIHGHLFLIRRLPMKVGLGLGFRNTAAGGNSWLEDKWPSRFNKEALTACEKGK